MGDNLGFIPKKIPDRSNWQRLPIQGILQKIVYANQEADEYYNANTKWPLPTQLFPVQNRANNIRYMHGMLRSTGRRTDIRDNQQLSIWMSGSCRIQKWANHQNREKSFQPTCYHGKHWSYESFSDLHKPNWQIQGLTEGTPTKYHTTPLIILLSRRSASLSAKATSKITNTNVGNNSKQTTMA